MAMLDLMPSLGIAVSLLESTENPLWIQNEAFCNQHISRSLDALRPFLENSDASGPRYPYHIYDDIMMRAHIDLGTATTKFPLE